ncbi:F0F1 ATP synthase subunit gamma [Angustibacter sp. Root456]|uniref:F0F1 ATP synthase subunit gamma n=1 Tax=Angustibacter sp. Root456 TaxID=1736539 RepID=UPI0006F1CCEA|nr:F0F1 ATP synthase subunit gamma [Angustibacter sp. Root456]KQX69682.1 ATP synthase F0F1 subunit gamma [Angustibacter sp. Root456]
MGAQQRVYRQRINSTTSLKKIFSAMELIATSRIAKARSAVEASTPYARAITRAVSAVATWSNTEHPLITEKETVRRAAVLLITSDRGMAGAYSANVLKEGERLGELLRERGVEPVPYVVGRKGSAYFRFRRRETAQEWTGFSESPQYDNAREIGDTVVDAFVRGSDDGGVDEIHVVFTRFVNMVTQTPDVIRLLPLEVVEGEAAPAADDVLPLYEFEPNAEAVFDALLPRYIGSRIYNCLLQASASEQAARQRAMKSASDNASDLIRLYTRLANQARQAEITQEISEIVGGADALASAGVEN